MIFLSYPALLEELLGSGVIVKSDQTAVSSQHIAENWINSMSLLSFAFLLSSWMAKSIQSIEANLLFNPLHSHYEVKQQCLKQAQISTDPRLHRYVFYCCYMHLATSKRLEHFEATCVSIEKENLRQKRNVLK